MNISSRMAGFGHYAPLRKINNCELESQLGLDPGWIEKRTGILSRRWAEPEETLTSMAEKAGRMALEDSGVDSNAVALTLLATSTPDHLLPPSAPLLAFSLGLSASGAIDLMGACSGFLYALALADSFVRVHNKPVLVVAANILSRRVNMKDRNTAAVFADAAGAVVLVPSLTPESGMIGIDLVQEGQSYNLIQIPAGGSARPLKPDYDINELNIVMPSGKTVFTNAVRMMSQASEQALQQAKLAAKDVERFFPHQANYRIIHTVCDTLGIATNLAENTIREYGNSSAATIPLTLSMSNKKNPFKDGERLLLTAAGAGMAGGAIVWKHSL